MRAADFALGDVECLHVEPAYHYEKRQPEVLSWEGEPEPPPYYEDINAWSRAPEWGVFRIANAYTFGRGAIARADGTIYPGSLHEVMGPDPAPMDPATARKIRGKSILATVGGTKNYGHWLVDILPRISWMRRELDLADANIIIHQISPPVVFDMFAAIGVPREKIRVVNNKGALCEELFVCSLWSQGPNTHRREIFSEVARIGKAIRRSNPDRRWWKPGPSRPKRIFLAREDARSRFLNNTADLEKRLVADGFVKMNTGNLPLYEQVEVFRAAREIVAIAGASLTNMIFCKPGYRLTMLAPRSMPGVFFWDMAHHTRAGFFAAHYGVAEDPDMRIRSNFTVDLDSVWPPSGSARRRPWRTQASSAA